MNIAYTARLTALVATLTLTACAAEPGTIDPGESESAIVPSGRILTDQGWLDVESEYLPGVVDCELGWFTADQDALRAQAVAARTYLARAMEASGSLGRSVAIATDATFQCRRSTWRTTSLQAVSGTAGITMTHGGLTIYANYDSGVDRFNADGTPVSPRHYGFGYDTWSEARDAYVSGACGGRCLARINAYAWTEIFVTYNEGRSGSAVTPTVQNSRTSRNRGAFGQYKASWLAERGYTWQQILRHFYGADIAIGTDTAVTPPPTPMPADGCREFTSPVWTCRDDHSARIRCREGRIESEACANGCTGQPIGVDDFCTPAAPVDACAGSASGRSSVWTCTADGGSRQRCLGDRVETDGCARGCAGRPIGVDDVCIDDRGACGSFTSPVWTCRDDSAARIRCVAGHLEYEPCYRGCTGQPVGVDDFCS